MPLPGPLALAPLPQGARRDAAGQPTGGDFAPASAASPAPGSVDEPVVLEHAGVARGVALVRLVFFPARPIGQYPQEHLRLTTQLRVSLHFAGPDTGALATTTPDPLLTALRSAVINPDQVQPSPLTSQTAPVEHQPQLQPAFETSSAWVVEVGAAGMTVVSYDALAGAGFPVSGVDPHDLRLSRAGIEIPAEWDGDDDAVFEPGERLLFYADPRFSRWTPGDVYLLWADASPGLRVPVRSAVPAGAPPGVAWAEETAEVNALYTPDCFCGPIPPGRDGDRWTWDDLKRPGRPEASYAIDLPAVDAAQPATLTLWLIGYTDVAASPDHRVDVSVNDTHVGRIEWDGKRAASTTLPIAPGILHDGANTVTLTLPGLPGVGIEGAWLDAFSIRYARGSAPFGQSATFTGQPTQHSYSLSLGAATGVRAYDMTVPDSPLRVADVSAAGDTISLSDPPQGGSRRYVLATEAGLLAPAVLRPMRALRTSGDFLGADYVMVTPLDFVAALGPLVALRQAQGLTVAMESVEAIYDHYGDGRPDPEAIRAYLTHAYSTWTPRPLYVLLVGDGSFDPRRYRADSPPTFVPPYLADVDPWAGETAADNRYAAVDGVDAARHDGRAPAGQDDRRDPGRGGQDRPVRDRSPLGRLERDDRPRGGQRGRVRQLCRRGRGRRLPCD